MRVELVVHGAGLTLLTKKDSTMATEVAQLKTAYDVAFTACSNTMKAMNLTTRDLVEQWIERFPPWSD